MIPLAGPRPTCIYRRFTLHTAGRRCHRRREKHDSGSHGLDKCCPSIFHAAIGLVSRMCDGSRLPDLPDSFIPLIGDICPGRKIFCHEYSLLSGQTFHTSCHVSWPMLPHTFHSSLACSIWKTRSCSCLLKGVTYWRIPGDEFEAVRQAPHCKSCSPGRTSATGPADWTGG